MVLDTTAVRIPGNRPPKPAATSVPAVSRKKGNPNKLDIKKSSTLEAIPHITSTIRHLLLLFFMFNSLFNVPPHE